MSWEVVKPKSFRLGGDVVRFTRILDGGKPRIKMVFGAEVIQAMKWKLGDSIQVNFNRDTLQIGFQKSKIDAYRLCGRHKSGSITISFAPSEGLMSRVFNNICGAGEQKPTIEKSMLILNCREFVK